MTIHIMFTDGRNPYLRMNIEPMEFAKEILKLSKNFDLVYTETTGGDILHFAATNKLTSNRPADELPW